MDTDAIPNATSHRYELGQLLGAGAFATVWSAQRTLADGSRQPVAVKVLHTKYQTNSQAVQRFFAEARLCLGFAHPHVVRVYDLVNTSAGLSIVMERIDGLSLEKWAQGTRSFAAMGKLLRQCLSALAYVHGRGVLHRDISPGNVLVTRSGEAKMTDFGLSKILATPLTDTAFKGTAPYASPEALNAQALEPRSDLYSLAAVFYELLTGSPPFGHGTSSQILSRQRAGTYRPIPRQVPAQLRELVHALLQPRHNRRYHSAAQVMAAWHQTAPSVCASNPRPSRRSPLALTLLFVLSLSAAIATNGRSPSQKQTQGTTEAQPGAPKVTPLPPGPAQTALSTQRQVLTEVPQETPETLQIVPPLRPAQETARSLLVLPSHRSRWSVTKESKR